MICRRAIAQDIPGIHHLLDQVLMVHYAGRPDLFKPNTRKYTDEELAQIIADDDSPVFVAVDEDAAPGELLAHCFCQVQDFSGSNNMQPIRTLYIDDLCVDEACRGRHVGSALYDHVIAFAREGGFYNVTLNVWSCNPNAMAFYESRGLLPYKVGMEKIL